MQKKQITVILAFLLIFFSNFTSVNAVDRSLVGVEVGDKLNLKIVANSFDPAILGIDFDALDVDLDQLSLDTIGFTIDNLIPDLNDVVGVEVVTLPDNSTIGEIKLSYLNLTETLPTDFYIGTPVALIDWDGWSTILENVTTDINAIDGVYATTINRVNNDTYFMNYVYLSIELPEEIDESLGIHQKMTYEKSTGFLEMMEIKIVIELDAPLEDIVQVFKIIRTDEVVTQEPETNTESDTESENFTPGFELITLIGSIFIISKYKRRNN